MMSKDSTRYVISMPAPAYTCCLFPRCLDPVQRPRQRRGASGLGMAVSWWISLFVAKWPKSKVQIHVMFVLWLQHGWPAGFGDRDELDLSCRCAMHGGSAETTLYPARFRSCWLSSCGHAPPPQRPDPQSMHAQSWLATPSSGFGVTPKGPCTKPGQLGHDRT